MSLEKINNSKDKLIQLYKKLGECDNDLRKKCDNDLKKLDTKELIIKKSSIINELKNLTEELGKFSAEKINFEDIIKSVEKLKERILSLILKKEIDLPLKHMTEEEEILDLKKNKEVLIRGIAKKISNVNVDDMIKNKKAVEVSYNQLAFNYSDLIKCNKKLGIEEKNVKNSIESKMVHLVDKIKIIKEKFSDHEITVKEIENSIQDLKDTISKFIALKA
jgi:Rad3-related DNA helicase